MNDTIRKGDASFVQVVHTDKSKGIWEQIGDVDIYIKNNGYSSYSSGTKNDHNVAFFTHLGTSTKRFYMYAHENESRNGTILRWAREDRYGTSQCMVGVYATLKPGCVGKKLFVGMGYDEHGTFWNETGQEFTESAIVNGVEKVEKLYPAQKIDVDTYRFKEEPFRFACITTSPYVFHGLDFLLCFLIFIWFLILHYRIHLFPQSTRILYDGGEWKHSTSIN